MDYIYFIVLIAAVSFVLTFYLRSKDLERNSRGTSPGKQQNSRLNRDPIPPRKRTISGPPENEEEIITFLKKVDHWEKRFEARRPILTDSEELFLGKGKSYCPPQKGQATAMGG